MDIESWGEQVRCNRRVGGEVVRPGRLPKPVGLRALVLAGHRRSSGVLWCFSFQRAKRPSPRDVSIRFILKSDEWVGVGVGGGEVSCPEK